MKVGPKQHLFTSGLTPSKGRKLPELGIDFKAGARFNTMAKPLAGRVKLRKPSKAAQKLTKQAQSVIRGVPTPFNR